MKDFFLRIISFIKSRMNPVTVAIVAAAIVIIVGIVTVCVNRLGIKKKSPFDGMPVKIITFPAAEEEEEEPEEEEKALSGKVENDSIKSAEKDKVLESPCILEYDEDNGFGYLNNCVFLGDSRTVGMVNYKCISDEDALAKVGLMHTDAATATFTQNSGKSYTVKQYLAEKKADVVYVCYGVNGMDSIPEDRYKETYTDLVDKIIEWAPNSNIVIMSVWPVDDYGVYQGKVRNEWIDKYNTFLMKLAEDKHIHYLDVNTVLKNDKGSIKAEYDGGDGLHYSAYAYGTILDYIVTHPVPGVSDEGEYKVHYVKPKQQNKIPAAPQTAPAAVPEVPAMPEITVPDPALEQPVIDPAAAEEEERRRREEEEEEQRRREEEEEEQRRKEEEEEEQRRKEEEEEEQRKREEEEERRRREEEEEEEEERRRREEEEEERRRREEEEQSSGTENVFSAQNDLYYGK